ncbi:MAG: hypothetical protein VYE40_11375 [Myxococcota bacterium]|nr:hypothetical protein [Myxococcota bacterium]
MTEEQEKSYGGLAIKRGKRHCKIVDTNNKNEVIFRTTNLRDAEHYLDLIEERDRLQTLLDARGIAPHRIYLLALDETKRGRVNAEKVPAAEVVIVAKADDDAVVVRYLDDGREEIVDLEELEPIDGGSYLQGPEVTDESVYVLVRFDRENDSMCVAVSREEEGLSNFVTSWTGEEAPGSEYAAALEQSAGDLLIYKVEASVED